MTPRPISPASSPAISPGRALALAAPLLSLPLLLPQDAFLARALLTAFAISLALKLRLLVAGDVDAQMLATPARLLVWMVIPQATCWPRSAAEAAAVRQGALSQLGRAVMQAMLMLALVAVKIRFGVVGRGLLALTAIEMLEFFLLLSALADGLTGLAALRGIRAEPVFAHPAAARSPSDFWSRRWNLVVHRFARRYVFLPLCRRRGPLLAALLTFGASGLMHEYLVLASVGPGRYRPGFMLGFFLLQALAVLTVAAVHRRRPHWALPRALAIPVNLGWLLATAALFFHPLRPQITAFDRGCYRLVELALTRVFGVVP